MSYFSILDFLKSGERSLEANNYYSALSIALTLPSMCSRIEYKNNDEYHYYDKNGKFHWRDGKAYIDFCNVQFTHDKWLSECLGQNVGDILYNLRCDIVHAGCADIYDGDYAIWLSYGCNKRSCTEFSKYKIVSIEGICKSIFENINIWISTSGALNYQHTLVFGNTQDDILLYNRLCDEERAKYLEENFIKELTNHEKS